MSEKPKRRSVKQRNNNKKIQQQKQKQKPQILSQERKQQPKSYIFIQKQIKKLLYCKLCGDLYTQPYRLFDCGHVFCEKCITSKQCPLKQCRYQIKHMVKDFIVQGLISQMMVKCINKQCPYTGTLFQFKNYHENNCKLANCNGIDGWLQSLRKNLQKDVPRRRIRYSSDEESGFHSNFKKQQSQKLKQVKKEKEIIAQVDLSNEISKKQILKL